MLSKCQTLREYMYFVDMVRKNNEISGNLEDAIEKAINQCMEENVLRDFLAQHREEVMHVMTLDYTFERRLEMQRAEAIEDGERIGHIRAGTDHRGYRRIVFLLVMFEGDILAGSSPGWQSTTIKNYTGMGLFNNAKNATFKNIVMTNVTIQGKEMGAASGISGGKVQVFQYHSIRKSDNRWCRNCR